MAEEMEVEVEDEEDVVGCLPRLFAPSHKQEVFSIVSHVDRLAEAPEGEIESRLERYKKLLDLYQEQPRILDPSLQALVDALLSEVVLPQDVTMTSLPPKTQLAFVFLAHLMKVRGYKVVMRLMPHQVHFVEPLLLALENLDASTSPRSLGVAEKEMMSVVRYVLLLWLALVLTNPFQLSRFDTLTSTSGGRVRSTQARALELALECLKKPLDKVHYAAAELVAQLVARADGHELLPGVVENALDTIRNSGTEGTATFSQPALLGNLILILAVFKQCDRRLMLPLVVQVRETIAHLFPLNATDSLLRKCAVKLAQRVGLVLLRPRLAKWRYRRGKRRLEDQLESGDSRMEKRRQNGVTIDEEDDDDEEMPDPQVEWVLEALLNALGDADTAVRWSAAKGVGRICGRLPKILASEVFSAILGRHLQQSAGYASWHGACLALAELSRRGHLLPEDLPRAVPLVIEALFFEEPIGRHAMGSCVRDAACYVVWAWARAYEAVELRPYVHDIARALINVTVFDREVNIRRAASAALQENVGRQGMFPNGIALLTMLDYHAVGNRNRCYLKLSRKVADFEEYGQSLIEHLLSYKVAHWDANVRELAGRALGVLARPLRQTVFDALHSKCLPGAEDEKNPIRRHGCLMALAHGLFGWATTEDNALRSEHEWRQDVVFRIRSLPGHLYKACAVKTKSTGGEITRTATTVFVDRLSRVGLPLEQPHVAEWLSLLELLVTDTVSRIQETATEAATVFFQNYVSFQEQLLHEARDKYVKQVVESRMENSRIGASCLLTALPSKVYAEESSYSAFSALANALQLRTDVDAKWAMARVTCVEGLARLIEKAQEKNKILANEVLSQSLDALLSALDDYTIDQRGDIGRTVREAAMKALTTLVLAHFSSKEDIWLRTLKALVGKCVQLSVEKIANTRVVAAECLQRIIHPTSVTANFVDDRHALTLVYTTRDAAEFRHDSMLREMGTLLRDAPTQFTHLLLGLVVSAGGLSENTTRASLDALLDHMATLGEGEQLETFLNALANLFAEYRTVPRVAVAVLQILPSMFARLGAELEARPDESAALAKLVDLTAKALAVKSAQPTRLRLAVAALCSLLHVNAQSKIWKTAVELTLKMLNCSFPVLRRTTAEELYEGLCMRTDALADDSVLALLAETSWHETGHEEQLSAAVEQIRVRLLDLPPS